MWKKEHQSGFCRSWHFGRSGVEKSVQKAFKTVRKRSGVKKAFWSGNSRSGVLFLLNLAKFICIYIINKCIYIYIHHHIPIYTHCIPFLKNQRPEASEIASNCAGVLGGTMRILWLSPTEWSRSSMIGPTMALTGAQGLKKGDVWKWKLVEGCVACLT